MNRFTQSIFITSLLMDPLCSQAAADPFQTTMNISGTLVSNGSCTFNQGGPLTVDFGNVQLTGSKSVTMQGAYQQALDSEFTCTGDSAGLLQMKLTSAGGTYDSVQGTKVLSTDTGIVGVELLVDGAATNADEWFTINEKKPPVLEAKLVQVSTDNSSGVVSGDTFSASGTLMLAFN